MNDAATPPPHPRSSLSTFPGLRWWIVSLVFLATLISYIDRLTISVLAPVICSDLHLSDLAYAGINSWFLLTYSLGMTAFGKLEDWLGTRRGFAAAMSIWSVAEVAHAAARTLGGLSLARLALGLGESGHWPAATKTPAEWFPPQERAFAMGIINSGASLGSAVAAPLVVWLDLRFGWQATFVVTGSLGFVWLALWFAIYHPPERHPRITLNEKNWILHGRESRLQKCASPPWAGLIRHREVWGIVLARFFGDPLWWLYLIWLPLYLHTVRGFTLRNIGLFVWIPYVAADAGGLLGGWTSGRLIACGWKVYQARGVAILFATLLAPVGALVSRVNSPVAAIIVISVVLFSFQFWVNNVQTLPSDLFPPAVVGSIAGLAGSAAGIGAIIFTLATGWMVQRFSYRPVLFFSALLLPLATLMLGVFARPQQFDLSASRAGAIEPMRAKG